MLDSHERVRNYEGHEIYLRKPGFEFTPVTLLKIASFLVRGPTGQLAVFAFAYSLLDEVEREPFDEDALLDSAVRLSEAMIDASEIEDRTDRTFRYRSGQWEEVENPDWWISASD
jgi:hypothetical protein